MQTIDVAPTAPGNDAISRIEMAPSNTQPGTGYHIHPTMVDGLLQLLSCAAINGLDRKAKLWLPTSIENLTMKRCSEAITAHVSGDITSNGSIHGHGTFTSNGKIFLQASGIHLALGNGSESNSISDTHAAARYTWGPDIDFIDIGVLGKTPVDRGSEIALLDHLTTLCLGCSQPDGSMSRPPSTHLKSYAQWISKQVRTGTSGTSTPTDQDIVLQSLEEWAKRLSCKPAAAAVAALQDVFSNLPAILRGDYVSSEGLHESILADLSRFTNSFDTSSLVKHVCHSKPNLRVLEIGQDAPRPSSLITESLLLSNGEVLCSQYTFTTKSYTSTTDQDTPFPAMEFLTLDINNDLEEEGFNDRQYDLIVFPNVVGSASISPSVLQNIKNLLAPEGRLVLQVINTDSVWARYVFGSQPSWWLGSPSDDDHPQGGHLDALQRSLSSSGLGRVDCVAEDGISTTVIARPTEKKILAKKVSVLYTDPDEVEGRDDPIVLQLEGAGYQLTKSSLSNPNLPPGQDVICLLDRAGPFFETLLADQLEMLRMLVTKLEGADLFWVTEHCQMGVKDPRYAPVIGFARTMRTEMLVDFATCEIEDWVRDVPLLVEVFQKFQSRNQAEDDFKPELEFSIKESQVHIGRYYPFSLPIESSSLSGSENYILDVETPGRITSLQFEPSPRTAPAEGEIEFEVAATGLNFRVSLPPFAPMIPDYGFHVYINAILQDVLIAMNIVELQVRRFGPEASGIVTRVGPGVTGFKVGDRIVASVFAGFKKYVCVPAFGCVQLPDSIDFIEASSLLIPYITAIYSLINIGRLAEGQYRALIKTQSILIHSACGGVGLAALMIAQMLKADIYTSVGSEEKVQYLHKEFGLPLNRILHSRDDSFVADVMRETNGRGVDLVLNSLSGELLHATWNCVAAFGTMVEIGKRDLIGNGKLDMRPFLANRNYSCVDIDHFWQKPALLKHLVTSTIKYRHEGHIRAMPVKLFPASEVREAFRYMQKGHHIGRVSVAMRDDLVDEKFTIEVVPRPLKTTFNGSASYLLVGGLGGLGRAVSRWMVEQGARELIYLSRSAQKTGDTSVFVEELQAAGCHVQLVAGDVTKPEDVVRAVTAASQPLKGIIQLSMVLHDENFESMTIDDWNAAVAPKVKGTWNLHNATKDKSLDFFLLFSSISGAVGQPGQANYASANTFLDAFVQYRESLGLVASVIDIGAVADIGVITQTRGLMSKMKSTGFKGVEEQELLDAIDLAIAQGCTRTQEKDSHLSLSWSNQSTFILGLGSDTPLKSSSNRTVWRNDRRMAIYHNKSGTSGLSDATTSSNQALKAAIAGALADSSTLKSTDFGEYLATEIGKKLFDLLLKPYDDLNTARPLVDLGLDSLVAIELRAWWKQMFGFDISVLEMLGMGSLHALGQRAVDGLAESAGGAE
ncbi:unnamed protein product [Clonostachys byssicola]|uniref:Carrier domain-containing protein n=1 Tax=Clonostachys byssicola TaxID=160290 RepID=A0A9N9UMC2_9HYPO|nr:unnamed protein product [Clonostachys byssicola]